MNVPWECPRCHKMKAPHVDECACPEPAAPSSALPVYRPPVFNPYAWPYSGQTIGETPNPWTSNGQINKPQGCSFGVLNLGYGVQ